MNPSNDSSGKVLNIPGLAAGSSGRARPQPSQAATTTSTPQPRQDAAAAVATPQSDDEEKNEKLRYLEQVKDFMNSLVVAEKTYQMYPSYSKVVKHSLGKLNESLDRFHLEARTSLQIRVSQKDFLYEDQVVYHEDHTGKSLAYRLYTDGIRGVAFLEDPEPEELTDFLDCFKELRNSSDEENDFGTIFWEKDCANVQLQIVDDTDTTAEDEIPDIPSGHIFSLGFDVHQLDLPPGEEERLREELSGRLSDDEGDSTFELTEEEAEKIRQLALAEEVYFPVYDFVDVLIELMIKNADPDAFNQATKMIRSIVFALVENLDFVHAAELLHKLSTDAHPGLTNEHKRQIKEMIGSFCDTQTLELLDSYLSENPSMPREHGLFQFLAVFDHNLVPHVCRLLKHHSHIPVLAKILLEIGKNSAAVLAKFIHDPDSQIAKAIIQILARLKDKQGIKRIAEALHHPDESLRKYAAKTILDLANKDAAPYLLPLLDEKSPELVHFALQFFLKVPTEAVYEKLLNLTTSNRFLELSKGQQAQAYTALMAAGGPKGIDHVINTVLKRAFTLGNKAKTRKTAALLSLSTCTEQRSIDILQKFAAGKSSLASTAKHSLRVMLAAEKKSTEDSKEVANVGE